MMTKKTVRTTMIFSTIFAPRLSKTVAKLIVFGLTFNPAPKLPSKLLLNFNLSVVAGVSI